ncbi:mechanosensitive ion channel family protein [Iodidimonas sp. SYSU 1G8]|uniref:mechanosensitive ion channel family protein n=1 Tax=Iodidimonas sp. SYSU 1G8 TaxID=3133967 RepID=UPI0031FE6568
MDGMQGFWDLTVDVWNRGLFGTTVGDILIAIFIVVVAVMVRGLFSRFVVANLSRLTARTQNRLDDMVIDAIAPPLRLLPVILGLYLAFRFLEPAPVYWRTAETIIRSLVAFAIFWAIFRAVTPVSQAASPLRTVLGAETLDWLVKAVRIVVAFIGGAIILEMWGIAVGPLLAGLGLFGVAVALGAQDLFKNLIAGMAILTEKRFSKGEAVSVNGVEGSVESIGFRSTFIRRGDRAPVYVPNTQMADNAVVNLSRRNHLRINWVLGLDYRTSAAQLRRIRSEIEAYITGNDDFAVPPEADVVVRIDALNTSSIDINVQCFTKTARARDFEVTKEELLLAIMDIVEAAGAGFAFPSQSLYVEKMPARPAAVPDDGPDRPATRPDLRPVSE